MEGTQILASTQYALAMSRETQQHRSIIVLGRNIRRHVCTPIERARVRAARLLVLFLQTTSVVPELNTVTYVTMKINYEYVIE